MKQCLIVDQGTPKSIKYDSLKNAYEKLLEKDMLFFLKRHPVQHVKNKNHFIVFKDCIELAEYIPVELFFSYIDGYVVSPYSTSLVLASSFSNITAVSLLDIIEWYDNSFKKKVKEMLMEQSGEKILFPKDMEEFKGETNGKTRDII